MKSASPQKPSLPISSQKWRGLFDAVYEINKARDYRDLMDAALGALQRLISADLHCIHLTDRSRCRVATFMAPENPFTEEEIAYYAAAPGRMPLVAHYERTGETCARRVSDVVSREEWLASEYYRTCMARLGFEHCLSLPVQVDGTTVAGLSMNRRRRDFTRRECELLDAFAPHLRLAWSHQEEPWPERAEAAARASLEQLGLSPREAEVLYWMTEGKQNREIAIILKRSLTTIQEHVANIVEKLDQENRHAATVFALRVRLQSGGPAKAG
ncbi:MAG TPA: helix-turn-helix domain-containing protein [Chthoniobacteraceae bacterium]|nr:helix-turn-helix domain-containing protein [Chthoniobacteraceae bacterium]